MRRRSRFLAYAAVRNAADEPRSRQDRIGLRLLERRCRLRHQPDADRILLAVLHLRPRLLGRPHQYAAGRRPRHPARDARSAPRSALRGFRRTSWWNAWRPDMSNSSATCRCCCSFCSGTTPSSRRCPDFANGFALPGGVLLNNRGLYVPRPLTLDGWHVAAVLVSRDPARLTPSTRWRGAVTGAWRSACGSLSRHAADRVRASRRWRFVAMGAPLEFEYPRGRPVQRQRRRRNRCRSSSRCCSAS